MLLSFRYILLIRFGCFGPFTLPQSTDTRNSCFTHFASAASVTTHTECEARCQSCDLLKEKLLTLFKKKKKRQKSESLSSGCPEISIPLCLRRCLDKVRLAAGIRLGS